MGKLGEINIGSMCRRKRSSRNLISNHCFVDGNKRIGVTIFLVLAKANKVKLKYTQDELVELAMKVATSDWQEKEILCWIWKHKS
jgi:death-on-curing family protein